MNILYRDNPVFISSFEYKLGSVRRELPELKAEGLMVGPTETLSEMGYRFNRGLGADETLLGLTSVPVAAVLKRVPNPSALIFQHCHSESAVLPLESDDTTGASRNRYFPAAVLKEVQLDNVPYFCSFASGCAGFLSLLISAGGVLSSSNEKPVLCAMADRRPPGGFFDMVRERILGSDHSSAFLVRRDEGEYQLLGISFYSTTRALVPLVEIVKRTVQMAQELAKALELDLAASEVVIHYPNIFPETWKMVTRYLRLPRAEQVIDEMAERAHCGASDSVISLSKMHRGEEGRVHVVVNYGVGLHLGVCILREKAAAPNC